MWSRGFTQYCLHHALQMIIRVALRETELSKLENELDSQQLIQFRKMVVSKLKATDNLNTS
jgi:hypothetical protein